MDKFENGTKVRVTSSYQKGHWYMGRELKEDKDDVTIGVVSSTATDPRPQIHVRITGGHLLNNPLYNRSHVWYCTDQCHVNIEVING